MPLPDVTHRRPLPGGLHATSQGSAQLDGVPTEPTVAGPRARPGPASSRRRTGPRTLQLLLAVGAGVSEGEFVNRAQAVQRRDGQRRCPGEATATVRVVPDPTFDCTDVIGKVFDDANRNGVQDDGEHGLPGVRVVTARGLTATTDALRPLPHHLRGRARRGPRQQLRPQARRPHAAERLPACPREQVQVAARHARQGAAFNFGASIHRVVGLDLADAGVRAGHARRCARQWKPRHRPAARGAAQGAGGAAPVLRRRRRGRGARRAARAARSSSRSPKRGRRSNCCYQLTIEPEVFWRRGGSAGAARRAQRRAGDRA